MLEQDVRREQLLPDGSLRTLQGRPPLLEPVPSVSRMVAHICHDLRLPLSAILANAEFLTKSTISEKERSEIYQEIRGAIEGMNELISSLLERSRDGNTFRPGVRNILDTVSRAIRFTCVNREFRSINITHHHDGRAVGWFDSNLLERVIANLVLNACQAVPADSSGRVVITTTGGPSCLQIGVWDNGPGIPPMIQGFIFRPFVSYGKAEGSGLGLAIAKKVVEDHGGEIFLDRSSGAGTLIKITIPFAIPDGAMPLSPEDPVRQARNSKGTVRSLSKP
jgi:signal transduction histidine kinase